MELRRPLKFLRLFLFTETASDVTERSIGRKRLCVDSILGFFCSGRNRRIFLGFHLSAILRRQNLIPLQILFGVNVLGFLSGCVPVEPLRRRLEQNIASRQKRRKTQKGFRGRTNAEGAARALRRSRGRLREACRDQSVSWQTDHGGDTA